MKSLWFWTGASFIPASEWRTTRGPRSADIHRVCTWCSPASQNLRISKMDLVVFFVSRYHVYVEDLCLPCRLRRGRVPDVQLERCPGEVKHFVILSWWILQLYLVSDGKLLLFPVNV